MYVIKDITGTTWYTDPAWFWVYGNKERRKNKIIKALIEVVNELISLEDLKPVAISYDPNQSYKNEDESIKSTNNNSKGNETIEEKVDEEWK